MSLEHGPCEQASTILWGPIRKNVSDVEYGRRVGERDFSIGNRNGILPAKNHCRGNPLDGSVRAGGVQTIEPRAVKIGLLQALGDANVEHLSQTSEAFVTVPKLHKPIEVERPPSELP
jgi:hypothetical protein